MAKILFTQSLHHFRMGGVDSYIKLLVNNLHKQKFEVINLKKTSVGLVPMLKQRIEVSLFASLFKRVRVLFYLFTFSNTVRRNDVDIVHANPSLLLNAILREGLFILVAKAHKKKVLVFFHGWNKSFEKAIEKRRLFLMLFRKIYGNADAFIVLASEFGEKLSDWGFKQKIYIETTSIDDELSRNVDVNKKIEIPSVNHAVTILFLSRIEKEKGIYQAIDAIDILFKKNVNILLIIAGDGSELDHCKEYVRRKSIENINFVGYVIGKQKQDVFLKADIYLFPTYGEGCPITVLEAMAFGLPVVTRNVGGLRDFFEDGKHGFVTESKCPEVYAFLLEKLITNKSLRHEISLFNYKYAQENFLASDVTKRIETIYLDLMKD